jgi:hypothetical protein
MHRTPAVDLNSVVVQTDNLLNSDLDGDTVLMSLSQTAYYGLEATAQRIWTLVAHPTRVADLCDKLVAEYAVERATCEHDVCAFLSELNREGLIRIVAEAEA